MVRGVETKVRADFSVQSDLPLFLCDPRTPWQRGSNENTTVLLRQYFPHGKSVAHHTRSRLDAVARELNDRPPSDSRLQIASGSTERISFIELRKNPVLGKTADARS